MTDLDEIFDETYWAPIDRQCEIQRVCANCGHPLQAITCSPTGYTHVGTHQGIVCPSERTAANPTLPAEGTDG